MKLILKSLCLGIVSSLVVVGCTSHPRHRENTKPQVVVTSTIITNLAAEIGGEEVQITGILKPGADPHIYEPVPADSRVLEKANLILYNGYNLEPGIIKLMNATGGNVKKIPVGEVVKCLKLDKGKGKIVPDPHVWGSAENVISMVKAIRDGLIELSPEDKNKFVENAKRLTDELQQLHIWINQEIQTIPPDKRKLITTHDAFQYYGNTYKIEISGTLIGISTEEQPSAQTVKKLVESIKKIGVPAIFAETTINPALIKIVAEEAGVKLAPTPLFSDSIGAKGSNGDTYIKMMVANTRAIVEALGGKYTPFQLKSKK
ncbi:MAG: metal ABC transporter solute-binding protein, Zn/Mn family [Aphanizomenon sp.]